MFGFGTMNNQTEGRFLQNVTPDDKGTGVFALPDVESSEIDAVKVIRVKNLTYKECILRGLFTMSFKWVPDSHLESEGYLSEKTCGEKTFLWQLYSLFKLR
ncbi:hypothetical protein [Rubinisphaera sp.]|uniref:hypothetical protein n=1 Tax=Rubinisphaera sp. TaxID=2024857 RepID=UPI000C0D4730|nr:hypothetical protein [Rubinisphaera sp.]MBV08750.1 hypothetical protein [Rubinisphaera sp.]HCS51586.1 hypothetical protein [Planctomycetaceae bacterium]|tara:strand:- start:151 stop:453 length:303 start_codon:yes stop_codon:yes gene_type:complete